MARTGVLLIQVPMMLDPIQQQVVQAARDSAFALRSAADLLKDLAIRYQNSDQSSDQVLRDSSGGLLP